MTKSKRNLIDCDAVYIPVDVTKLSGPALARYHELEHGVLSETLIVFKIDPVEAAEIAALIRGRYHPANEEEERLVETVVKHRLRYARLRRTEAGLWQLPLIFSAENMERVEDAVVVCRRLHERALAAAAHLKNEPDEAPVRSAGWQASGWFV